MAADKDILLPSARANTAAPLPIPSTSAELINTLAHYYRGEMARMMSWRDRIDRTTNWAITVTAALLSVSLSSPSSHHGVLLFAMLLVFLLLVIESRRYRFFDVYRRRVRLLERNYYAMIFAPAAQATEINWLQLIGEDLRMPHFYISLLQGMARRLRRNYCWLFLILLLAWVLKTTSALLQPDLGQFGFVHSRGEFLRNAAIVYIPGWLVLVCLLFFYGWLGYVMYKHYQVAGELSYGQVHV